MSKRLLALIISLVLLLSTAAISFAATDINTDSKIDSKKAPTVKVKKSSPQFNSQMYQKKAPIVPQGERKKVKPTFRPRPDIKPSEKKYAPDRIIVKYKNANDVKTVSALNSKIGLKKIKDLPMINAALMQITNGAAVENVIKQLKSSGLVQYAEPDYKVYPSMIPNDPLFPSLWGLNNWTNVDINAPEAWDITTGSPDLVVAVIDEGVDFNHPDLAGHIWTNPGEIPGDGIDNDGNGYVDDVHGWDFYNDDNTVFDPADGDFHGTHVSGTIAATINNNEGVAGVAPNVKIMPLKFLGPDGGYDSDAIEAIYYARNMGVRISNNSWGGGGYSQALYDAIASSGMLFVAAAGNNSNNADLYPEYPAAYNLPNIISVAACDMSGYLAWFSNYGPQSVDIAAPGVEILSTLPSEPETGAAVESNTGTYKTVFWGFGLEDMADAAKRADAMGRALNHLGFNISSGKVLLVDNDRSDTGDRDCNPYYYDALLALGIPQQNITVQVVGDNVLDLAYMQSFNAVIWQAGEYNYLKDAQLSSLESYLNSGGKLLLAGQDAIYSPYGINYFAPNYLHARWLGEGTPRIDLNGVPGTAYDGASYSLSGNDGWSPGTYRDMVTNSDAYGYVDLVYPASAGTYGWGSGTSMATPHVTGTAALVMSKNPELSPLDVKAQILGTAKRLYGWEGLTVTGGMVDAFAAVNREVNDDIPGVKYPAPCQTVTGQIDQFSDPDDVYSVYLQAGEKITATLSGDAGTDFDLYLYSPQATTVKSGENIVAYSEQYGTSAESFTYVAPENGLYYVNVYAYEGSGSYSLNAMWGNGPGTYEENHDKITYTGSWTTLTNPACSGGQCKQVNSQATASFQFTSTGVRIIAARGPNMGIAEVFIDQNNPVQINLNSTTNQFKQVVFEKKGLELGSHTITMRWTGRYGGKKTGTAINLDAFYVLNFAAPAAPQNLVATTDVNNNVQLTWDASTESDLAGYNVYRSTRKGGSYTKINNALVTTNSFSDAPAEEGTYYYVVTAVNNDGNESAYSNEAAANISYPPAPPQNLAATVNKNVITLTWSANTEPDLAGYNVYRSTTPGGQYELLTVNPTEATSYVDTVNAPGTYYYVVTAVALDGAESAYSQEVPATVTSIPPKAPQNLTASVNNNVITLSWTANTESELAGYYIYRSTTQGGNYSKLNSTPLTTTSYTDTVSSSGTYYYVVTAVNNAGEESAYSNEATAVVSVPGAGTIEDSSPAVKYTTSWSVSTSSGYSGGSLRYTNNTGAAAELVFEGQGIKWMALKSPNYGIVDVYIDNVKVTSVDLYDPGTLYKQIVFSQSGLTPGIHTIKIVRTGSKNPAAKAAYINLDAFIVW